MFDIDLPFFPEQASSIAAKLDGFVLTLVGLSFVFSIIVAALIVYFAAKYRWSDPDVDRSNPMNENTMLELSWSFVPLVISLTVFAWSAQVYFEIYTPPADTINLSVVGKQWMWKIQHPDGQREVNELHIPVNRPVKLTMTSQDVIHSFFIPAFRIKQDVLPGRFTTMWFEATQTGEYHLFCAEYCGAEHAFMIGRVYVLEPSEYEQWLREGSRDGLVDASVDGESLFNQKGCISCHQLDGDDGLGPNLIGVFNQEVELETGEVLIRDEEYIRESIINPQAKIVAGFPPIMPTFEEQLTSEELLMLVDYIESLADEETDAPSTN